MIAVFKKIIADLVDKCMSVFTYLPDGKNEKQATLIAVAAAVGIHLMLGIFLLVNADFTPKAIMKNFRNERVYSSVVRVSANI